MTQLRDIVVRGPDWKTGEALWSAPFSLAYGGPDDNHDNDQVLESPALRVLLQAADPDARLSTIVKNPHEIEVAFIPPRLLAAGVEADKTNTAPLRIAGGEARLTRTGDIDEEGRYTETRLLPLGPWPNAQRTYRPDEGNWEINTPEFRLAFGQVRGFLPQTSVNHLALKWTGGQARIFRDFAAILDQGRIPVRLTPEGMLIRLQAPDPFDPGLLVSGEFLLAPEPGGDLGLRLVTCDAADAVRLRNRLQTVVDSLRVADGPLRLSLNLGKTPPLVWPLERTAGQWVWVTDVVHMPRGPVAAVLETYPLAGGEPAIAELIGETVKLRRSAADLKLDVATPKGTDTAGTPGPDVTHAWSPAGAPTVTVALEAGGACEALVETAATEAAVLTAWKASRALPESSPTPPYLFLPLARGVLQIATPAPLDPARPPAPPKERERGAMTGAARLVLSSRGDDLKGVPASLADAALSSVEVMAAGQVTSVARWTRLVDGGLRLAEVKTTFGDARGSAVGVLWAGLASPTPDAILPSLATGSVSLDALPVSFGSSGGRGLKCAFSYAGNVAACALKGWSDPAPRVTPTAILWRPHPRTPLISSAPMTRTAAASARPSALRDLVPMAVRADGGQPLALRVAMTQSPWLPQTAEDPIPAPGTHIGWPWPANGAGAEPPAVSLVSPTLAGAEFAPSRLDADPMSVLIGSLRFDLPILDDLFAGVTVPTSRDAAGPPSSAPPEGPRPTALDPEALGRFWVQSAERLNLARTDADRAAVLRGRDPGSGQLADLWPAPLRTVAQLPDPGSVVDIDMPGLVEPYVWQTRLAFTEGAADLPLGEIRLDGQVMAGGAALSGLDKTFAAGALVPGAAVKVQGFAAETLKAGGLLRDNRGFALAATPVEGAGASVVWRETEQQVTAADKVARRHATAVADIGLGVSGNDLRFWFRDLPLRASGAGPDLTWKFAEPGGPDAALGADPALWSPTRLPAGLHEWRLYSDAGEPAWTVRFGPLAFRPLRLHGCEFAPAGADLALRRLVVIGAFDLADKVETLEGPVGPEDLGPGRNLAALVFGRVAGQVVLQGVSPVTVSPGTANPIAVTEAQNRVSVAFERSAQVWPGGRTSLVATFEVMAQQGAIVATPQSAQLKTRLFGCEVARTGGTVTLGSVCSLGFAAEAPDDEPAGGLAFDAIDVTLGKSAFIEVDARLVLRSSGWAADEDATPVRALLYRPGRSLDWIGARCALGEKVSEIIDHSTGLVRLDLKVGVRPEGDLFRGWPLNDSLVRGRLLFVCGADADHSGRAAVRTGHVELRWASGSSRVDHTLFQDREGVWRSRLLADGRWEDGAGETSTIGWPVGGLPHPLPSTPFDHGGPDTWRLDLHLDPAGESLTHVVRPDLRRQPLALSLLSELPADIDGWSKGTPYLERPWRLRCVVDHRLEAGGRALGWKTLDEVAIFDLRQLAMEAREDLAVEPLGPYAFQARYMEAEPDADRIDDHMLDEIPVAGVVRRALAQGGFPTRRLNKVLDAAPRASVPGSLIMVGGSVCDFHPEDDARQAVTATPVWIIGWAKGASLKPLDAIPQVDADAIRTYRAAPYDIAAARLRRLDGPPAAAVGLGRATAEAIELALVSSFGKGSTPPPLVPVDQSATYGIAPLSVNPLATPIWFRTLLALSTIWRQAALSRFRVTSVLASRTPEDKPATPDGPLASGPPAALRVGLVERKPRIADDDPIVPKVTLVVVGRSRTVTFDVPADLAQAMANGPEVSADLAARGALLGLALTAVPDPLVMEAAVADPVLSSVEQAVHGDWQSMPLPRHQVVAPPGRALRPPRSTLHASHTLGWPMRPPQDLARLAAAIDDEAPRRDTDIAWAGRARSIALPAYASALRAAASPDPVVEPQVTATDAAALEQPIYLASGRRVLFRRPGVPDLVGVPDRALTPAPPRARAPLASVVEKALVEASGATEASKAEPDPGVDPGAGAPVAAAPPPRFGPILPPRLSIAATGLRPGVLAFERDALLVGGVSRPFDPANVRFGAVASWAPMVWRQVRAPRSSALPVRETKEGRRRTYVSDADRLPSGDLAHFRLVRGSATLFRRGEVGDSTSMIFTPVEPAYGRLSPQFAGRVVVHVSDWASLDAEALTPAKLKAHLQIGDRPFLFETITSDSAAQHLQFQMSEAVAALAAAALADASADTAVTFVAQGGDPGGAAPATSALVPGPPRVVALPLTRIPAGRYWLPTEAATILFGDPAYDRELSSMTASDLRRIKGTAGGAAVERIFTLSLDRQGYDLAATVHLAGGQLDAATNRFVTGSGPEAPKGDLEISVVRAGGGRSEAEILRIVGEAGDTAKVLLGTAYALPLGALRTKEGKPALLSPGDQVTFRLTQATGFAKPDEVENPVVVEVLPDPVIAPPSSVYSVVTRETDAVRCALHAVAPMPDQIEFPALLDDLATGNVRRRALFTWRFGARVVAAPDGYVTLVKIDRTGGGQVPDGPGDFEPYAQEVV